MMDGYSSALMWGDARLQIFADREAAIMGTFAKEPDAVTYHPGKAALKHLLRYLKGERDEAMMHAFKAMELFYRSMAYVDDSKLADGDCDDVPMLTWTRRMKADTADGYSQLAKKVTYDMVMERVKQEAYTADKRLIDATRLVPTTVDATLIPEECFYYGKDALR